MILQTAPGGDWTVETKVDAPVTQETQSVTLADVGRVAPGPSVERRSS